MSWVILLVLGIGSSLPPDRGDLVGGTVVEEAGRPVAAAAVEVSWVETIERFAHKRFRTGTTDTEGNFVIDNLKPGIDVRLTARFGDAASGPPEAAKVGVTGSVTLRISEKNTALLEGRAVDEAGRPVEDAEVKFMETVRTTEGTVTIRDLAFEGRTIRTDADGRFRTPFRVRRDGEYAAGVVAEGMLRRHTDWIKPVDVSSATFPDLVLQREPRLRTVTGRVLDRDGRPVAGAQVIQSGDGPRFTTATTDDQGAYRLSGFLECPAYVFAVKKGFRFQGRPTGPAEESSDLLLTRSDERVERPLTTLPPSLPKEERVAPGRRVLEPYVHRVLSGRDEEARATALRVLVPLDPARVLELLDSGTLADSWRRDGLRLEVVGHLLPESLEEALNLIESLPDPRFRARGFLDAFHALPRTEAVRRREMLDRALVQARAENDPAYRVFDLGAIGVRLISLGETSQGKAVLREAETQAGQLSRTGIGAFSRSEIASDLAPYDLPAALELIRDLDDAREYDRHHGDVAIALAGSDLAEAERVLGMIRLASERERRIPAVCYHMVRKDRERAVRLASSVQRQDHYRAYALGVMALALAPTDRGAATRLLRDAYDDLGELVATGRDHDNSWFNAARIGAALLPAAEAIDPALVPEFLWRTLSFREPRRSLDASNIVTVQADARLALLLARYDRAIARRLIEPGTKESRTLAAKPINVNDLQSVFAAAVLIDPQWALRLVEDLPEDPGISSQLPKNLSRLTLAEYLGLEGKSLWRRTHQAALYLWDPDREDTP